MNATEARREAMDTITLDVRKLPSDGLMVDVDVHGMSLLETSLEWEDVGVVVTGGLARQIKPPRFLTVTPEFRKRFSQAETLARGSTWNRGLVGLQRELPDYRFVHWVSWVDFEDAWQKAEIALAETKADLLSQYSSVCAEIQYLLEGLARQSEMRLRGTGTPIPVGFQERVVAFGMAKIPSPGQIKGIRIHRSLRRLTLLGVTLSAQEQIEAAKADAALAAIQEEAEIKRRMARALESSLQKEIDAISPVKVLVAQLRGRMYGYAKSLKESLTKDGKIDGFSANKLRRCLEQFDQLSWIGDQNLERLVADLRVQAESPLTASVDDVVGVLTDIAELTEDSMREMHKLGRFASLEV